MNNQPEGYLHEQYIMLAFISQYDGGFFMKFYDLMETNSHTQKIELHMLRTYPRVTDCVYYGEIGNAKIDELESYFENPVVMVTAVRSWLIVLCRDQSGKKAA